MFWNILAIENTKTMKRAMLWIELGLTAVLVVGMFVMLFAIELITNNEQLPQNAVESLHSALVWPGGLIQSISFATGNSLGGLLLIILAGAVTAQEYTWRTMQLWLSRGVLRPTLLTAKFVALLLPATLIVLTPLLAGGLVSGIFTLLIDGSLHVEEINFLQLFFSTLRTTYTLLPYAGLAFLLSIITRSTAAAIGGALAYALLFEGFAQILSLLGSNAGKILACLPTNLSNALLTLNQSILKTGTSIVSDTPNNIPLLEPIPAAIGIALWTLAFVGTALLIFQKQDLSA